MGTIIKVIRYCSHCGNRAPQTIVHTEDHDEEVYTTDNELCGVNTYRNHVTVCGTCSKILIYEQEINPFYESDPWSLGAGELIWPKLIKFDLSVVPKSIIQIYEEACKIKPLAPSAFVVQIRRALEAICIEQGVGDKPSLHASLRELTNQGKLPPLLSEVTNIIKLIGNVGAHANGPPIYSKHVEIIDDFFRVLIEYLYIAPSKLLKFKEEADKFNS